MLGQSRHLLSDDILWYNFRLYRHVQSFHFYRQDGLFAKRLFTFDQLSELNHFNVFYGFKVDRFVVSSFIVIQWH